MRDTLTAEPENGAGLSALRYCHLNVSVKRRHGYFSSERCLHEGYCKINADIIALTCKNVMRSHSDLNIKISVGTSLIACASLPSGDDTLSIIYTGGYADFKRFLLFYAP